MQTQRTRKCNGCGQQRSVEHFGFGSTHCRACKAENARRHIGRRPPKELKDYTPDELREAFRIQQKFLRRP